MNDYKPGDKANGWVLNENNEWVADSPVVKSKGRHRIKVAGAAMGLVVAIGLVGGGADPVAPPPTNTTAPSVTTSLAPKTTTTEQITTTTLAPTTTTTEQIATTTIASIDGATVELSRIIDGDTIEALVDGEVESIRLIGIDTPERGDDGFQEAADALTELLSDGEIRLERDVTDRDRYGRLLAYVFVGDFFVNEIMVREGWAVAHRYPPDTKYAALFDEAQVESIQHSIEPSSGGSTTATTVAPSQPTTTKAPSSPTTTEAPSGGSVSYKNCDAVRAAGAAPIHEGDPGWNRKFDRDGDGVGCE